MEAWDVKLVVVVKDAAVLPPVLPRDAEDTRETVVVRADFKNLMID